MKPYIHLTILFSAFIAKNCFAIDCHSVTAALFNINLANKITYPDGYHVTTRDLGNEMTMVGLLSEKADEKQQQIHIFTNEGNVFEVRSSWYGYTETEAHAKLQEIKQIIGKEFKPHKTNPENQYGAIDCEDTTSIDLFISYQGTKNEVSYDVGLFVRDRNLYAKVKEKSKTR